MLSTPNEISNQQEQFTEHKIELALSIAEK